MRASHRRTVTKYSMGVQMDPAIISHRFHSTRKQFINAPRTQPDLLLSSDRFRGFSTPYTYIHTYLHTYTQRYEYEAALCCRISTNRSLKPAGHRKVGRCNVMCWIFNGTASDVGPGTFRLSRPYTTTYIYIYIHLLRWTVLLFQEEAAQEQNEFRGFILRARLNEFFISFQEKLL